MRKILRIMAIILSICCLSTSVLAKENISAKDVQEKNIKVGALYENKEGQRERIIRVNKDGSFVTESIDMRKCFSTNRVKGAKSCSHTRLLEISTKTETSTVGKKSCCYKSRKIVKSRCENCSKIFTTYGRWTQHKKHSYKLFGKKCKICGYKK